MPAMSPVSIVSIPVLWCILSREEFGSMECAVTQDMKAMLRGGENTEILFEVLVECRDKLDAGRTRTTVRRFAWFG